MEYTWSLALHSGWRPRGRCNERWLHSGRQALIEVQAGGLGVTVIHCLRLCEIVLISVPRASTRGLTCWVTLAHKSNCIMYGVMTHIMITYKGIRACIDANTQLEYACAHVRTDAQPAYRLGPLTSLIHRNSSQILSVAPSPSYLHQPPPCPRR